MKQTTKEQHTKSLRMPHNPHLLNLNVQDVVDDILNQEPKDTQDEVVDRHIRESSHLELIALGVTISEKNIESRHLIEAITEGVIQDTRDDLREMLNQGNHIREISEEDLMNVNEERIYQNLLRMTIREMTHEFDQHGKPDEDHVYQEFLNAPLEMQERLDLAIQEVLAEHQDELQDMKRRVFQGIRNRMSGKEQTS